MARPAKTVLEVATARGGVLKGARVTHFIMQWTLASSMLGKPISLSEYAEWWDEPHSTAFRHQRRFREVFPEFDTPQPIANRAMAKSREKIAQRGIQGIGSVNIGGLVEA